MEENNNLLECCVRELFGGCGANTYSPALRLMFASVLRKDADGCFSLKTSPSILPFDVTRCGDIIETVESTGVVIQGTTQPIPVCVEGGQPIELGGYEACYDGAPAHIEIIRDETTGAIDRYVAHYKDGSGTVVDPADMTLVSNCPVTEAYDVCDVVTATITGDITYTITGADVALSTLTGLTFTNDTVKYFWTDFGNGFSDVGSNPSVTYVNDGHYEIKTYAVMTSGNKVLLAAKELDVVSGVITVVGSNPQAVAQSYPVSVGTAMQEYSGTTPVGSPTNPDGSAYTVQGTLAWNCPAIIDDLEDNAEFNSQSQQSEVQVETEIVSPLDPTGSYTGQLVRVERTYTNGVPTGVDYYDTVTGLPVTLPAGTTQLAPVSGLDTEVIELCDDNGKFLRHIPHMPGGRPIVGGYDTLIDGSTPYSTVGTVKKCSDSGDIVECTTTTGGNAVTEATDTNLNGIASVIVGGGGSTIFHTMLGNPGLNYVGDGTTGAMIGGINVSVAAPIIGAQFTITLDSPLDDDPLENSDLVPVVWSNTYSTSVTATSITTPLIYSGTDVQGSGLNMPIYGYPDPISGPYTIVWTGDLPVGDYTVAFINQNQSAADNVIVSITHNIVEGGSTVTTKAQLMALDECTIAALTPEPVIPPIEVPGGAIIVNTAALSVIAPANVRSFSVKGLANKTYDISFDSGTNWLNTIDGGDSWGEGNEYQIDISQVLVRPTVSGDRVFIHWEVI
jgi:hypothetical protein